MKPSRNGFKVLVGITDLRRARIATCLSSLCLAAGLVMGGGEARAWQEQTPLVRELFVPYAELDVILESDPNRVFLTRDEYEELIESAREKPIEGLPRDLVLPRGLVQIEIQAGRARVMQTLEVEVLRDEQWFELPLSLAGVGISSAELDGSPASLARGADGQPRLLVRGKGIHELKLTATALVSQSAAQQGIDVTLPRAAANQVRATVAGNVELRSGAPVKQRSYDETQNVTVFELAPTTNRLPLVFSTNNRQSDIDQQLLAQSVLIDEVTQGYERLHATVSLLPLRGKLSQVKLRLPNDFEVTRCDAAQ
ncbi:MAG: hypothetical protein R3B96_24275, partial [Pirellulaceae bacterium]